MKCRRSLSSAVVFFCLLAGAAERGLDSGAPGDAPQPGKTAIELDPAAATRVRAAGEFFKAIRSGSSAAERVEPLMRSLRADPDSATKLKLLLAFLRREPRLAARVAPELRKLAAERPDLPMLTLTALRLTPPKTPRAELIKLEKIALERLDKPETRSIPDRSLWTQLFAFYLLHSAQEGVFAEPAELFDEVWPHRKLQGFELLPDAAAVFFLNGSQKAPDHRRWLWLLPSRREQCRERFNMIYRELHASDDGIGDPPGIIRRLELYSRLGKEAEAIAFIEGKIAEAPHRPERRIILGEHLFRNRRYSKALNELRILMENPKLASNFRLNLLYADCAVRAKAFDEAAACYRKLLLLPKTPAPVRYLLINSLIEGRHFDEALAELGKLPDEPLRAQLTATVHFRQKKYPEVISVLGEAEKRFKTNPKITLGPEYHLPMLLAASEIRDKSAVERCYQVFSAQNRFDNPMLANAVGYVMADLGMRLGEAEKLIRFAVAREPGNYAYADSLAWVLFRRGAHRQAEEAMARALELAGKEPSPVLLEHAGDIAKARGRKLDAIAFYKRALTARDDPEFKRESVRKKLAAMLAPEPAAKLPAKPAK